MMMATAGLACSEMMMPRRSTTRTENVQAQAAFSQAGRLIQNGGRRNCGDCNQKMGKREDGSLRQGERQFCQTGSG